MYHLHSQAKGAPPFRYSTLGRSSVWHDAARSVATIARLILDAHITTLVVSAAWQEPYKGSTSILKSVLNQYMEDSLRYACYASITQSSGTGKSRMVDELAREILCIPMCLGSDQAYPPPDVDLRYMFQLAMICDVDVQSEHVQLLMCAVFETALERVKMIVSDPMLEGQSLASRFRQLMSEGMAYRRHGQYWQQFYEDVRKRAGEVCLWAEASKSRREDHPTPIASVYAHRKHVSLMTAAEALTSYLSTIQINPSQKQPSLLLSFDEARLLTSSDLSRSGVTLFPHVRHALHIIRELPIVAVFLSTVGQLEQCPPPPELNHSDKFVQLNRVLFKPIVWTPLDILVLSRAWHAAESPLGSAYLWSTWVEAHIVAEGRKRLRDLLL
ncbi:hypothetical protein BV20DRAFT_959369 [Pilatotrama ljubarskyi]|nr:hypothetical protein BV20DRAFT_959369 [Pilatotrama ljubarskyi]